MAAPTITRNVVSGVALLSDLSRPGGVTLAFTERTGGVSTGPYASLNLDAFHGDDPTLVTENRRRALEALDLAYCGAKLINPLQVHGSTVLTVTSDDPAALDLVRAQAAKGADGIVCLVPDVPVMLLSADCALVTLVAQGGFAVVHSGWRGTFAEISGIALEKLCAATGSDAVSVRAYVWPHIERDDYQVSAELLDQFVNRFGPQVSGPDRTLDLSQAIRTTLLRRGVDERNMAFAGESTASNVQRFYSWRSEQGNCGRNAAIACLCGGQEGVSGGRASC